MANDRSRLFGSNNKSYGTAINNDNAQKALERELETLVAIKTLADADNFKDAIYHSSVGKTRLKFHGERIQNMFQSLTNSAEQFKNNTVMMKGINRNLSELKASFVTHLDNAIRETNEAKTPLNSKQQSK